MQLTWLSDGTIAHIRRAGEILSRVHLTELWFYCISVHDNALSLANLHMHPNTIGKKNNIKTVLIYYIYITNLEVHRMLHVLLAHLT